jgi:hypothetical protein
MGNSLGYSFQWSGGKFTVFNLSFSVKNVAYGISNSGTTVGGYDTDTDYNRVGASEDSPETRGREGPCLRPH